jgi:amino acid permease
MQLFSYTEIAEKLFGKSLSYFVIVFFFLNSYGIAVSYVLLIRELTVQVLLLVGGLYYLPAFMSTAFKKSNNLSLFVLKSQP